MSDKSRVEKLKYFFSEISEVGGVVIGTVKEYKDIHDKVVPISSGMRAFILCIVIAGICGLATLLSVAKIFLTALVTTQAGHTILLYLGGIIGIGLIGSLALFFIGKIGQKSCNAILAMQKLSEKLDTQEKTS